MSSAAGCNMSYRDTVHSLIRLATESKMVTREGVYDICWIFVAVHVKGTVCQRLLSQHILLLTPNTCRDFPWCMERIHVNNYDWIAYKMSPSLLIQFSDTFFN